jgi:hypothetical protein
VTPAYAGGTTLHDQRRATSQCQAIREDIFVQEDRVATDPL